MPASRHPAARGRRRAALVRQTVSLEALETFIANFKAQVAERSGDREQEVDAQIAAAKKAVVAARTPDEDNNAHVMLGNALRAKQQLQKSVRQEVLRSMKAADRSSHLQPIYDAMIEPERRALRLRRDGGAVERSGLENRRPFAGLVGSNPTLSSRHQSRSLTRKRQL